MLRTSLTIIISLSFLCSCASEQAVENESASDVPVDAAPATNEEPVLTDVPVDAAPATNEEPVLTDVPAATDVPVVAPEPAPVVAPEPAPDVAPEPAPDVAPEPAPVVAPEPAPDVAPVVAPEPAPVVAPEPAPVVAPEPMPVVVAEPIPALVPLDPVAPAATVIPEPRFDVEFIGEEIFVSINGQRVAKEHLRRTSDSMEIISSSGQVIQTIPIPQPNEHPPVMIGVRFETTGKALTKHLGSDVSNCALVVAVMENGPGYMAGIEDFDLVTAVDGKTPATPEAIRDRLKLMVPGDSIVLTIRRGTIIKDYSLVSKAWKHVPLPAELQTPPITRKSSPILQGTPNMPSNTNSNGRPAAAPQQTVAPNS